MIVGALVLPRIERRHHRGVDDAQAVDALDAQLGVDHRAHRARADRVVEVVALGAHVRADRLLVVPVRHLVGLALVALQRRLLADLQALADAGDLDRPVLLGAEEVGEDPRLVGRSAERSETRPRALGLTTHAP